MICKHCGGTKEFHKVLKDGTGAERLGQRHGDGITFHWYEEQVVYVVMRGCYSDYHFGGVFSTLEKAKAQGKGTWTYREHLHMWQNDLDWDDSVEILVCTVDPV